MQTDQKTDTLKLTRFQSSGLLGAGGAKTVLHEREALFISLVLFGLCAFLISCVSAYPRENDYSQISAAIRTWRFDHLIPGQPRQFWGLPYLSAVLATVLPVSDAWALILISLGAYAVCSVLCCRLWGTQVGAWFSVLNWTWLREAVLAGAEPLFMVLLFWHFLAVRRRQLILASLLGSLATLVRPVGIIALLAMGLVLLWKREYIQCGLSALLSVAIATAYLLPFRFLFGHAFAQFKSYQAEDWAGSSPVTTPVFAVIRGAFASHNLRAPLTVLISAWVLFMLLGVVAMILSGAFRQYARAQPAETLFAGGYTAFLFSYNATSWGWQEFPRFALPVLPFILVALARWLPARRRLIWGFGLFSVLCVVLPVFGVDHALALFR